MLIKYNSFKYSTEIIKIREIFKFVFYNYELYNVVFFIFLKLNRQIYVIILPKKTNLRNRFLYLYLLLLEKLDSSYHYQNGTFVVLFGKHIINIYLLFLLVP